MLFYDVNCIYINVKTLKNNFFKREKMLCVLEAFAKHKIVIYKCSDSIFIKSNIEVSVC